MIILPLAAPRFPGDGITPRNPENMRSHFPRYKNLFIFTSVTVGLNPDFLYLPVSLLSRSNVTERIGLDEGTLVSLSIFCQIKT